MRLSERHERKPVIGDERFYFWWPQKRKSPSYGYFSVLNRVLAAGGNCTICSSCISRRKDQFSPLSVIVVAKSLYLLLLRLLLSSWEDLLDYYSFSSEAN
jgi:hypothetical protein